MTPQRFVAGDLIVVTGCDGMIELYVSERSDDLLMTCARGDLEDDWTCFGIVLEQRADGLFVYVYLSELGSGWLHVDFILEVVR